ncbi:hypothetical protein BSPA14S_I0040 (plasmid) [Borreliella spielmanii A14S]|uniref:Uncharacterized protein n=1 Tax=Borreliella spielmanii A14S TaxID=498742 RepID=C0RCB9_9SPIR|nr:hypothetical protein BSPA14S_I0040 [Borreliella spielmanii A14S]
MILDFPTNFYRLNFRLRILLINITSISLQLLNNKTNNKFRTVKNLIFNPLLPFYNNLKLII